MRLLRRLFFLLVVLGAISIAAVAIFPQEAALLLDRLTGSQLLQDSAQVVSDTVDSVRGLAAHIAVEEPATPIQVQQELLRGMEDMEEEIVFTLRVPQGQDTSAYVLGQVESALYEIRRDNPHIFWLGMGEYGVHWSGFAGESTVNVTVSLGYRGGEASMRSMEERIEEVLAEVVANAPKDPEEAAKYLHDWIVDNTVYDVPVAERDDMEGYEYAFNIDGVLLQGSAVCEGYTKTYKLLCDRVGIPNRIVYGTGNGENHAWNYVQLDGQWYLVDCTADDPVGSRDVLRWDYFLQGEQSVIEGVPVCERYSDDGGAYPVLALEAYSGAVYVSGEQSSDGEAGRQGAEIIELRFAQHSLLVAETASTAPGSTVGFFTSEAGVPQSLRLSGGGAHDSRFVLDASTGELTVGQTALEKGIYQIEVEVAVGAGTSVAAMTLEVEESKREQPREGERQPVSPGWIK